MKKFKFNLQAVFTLRQRHERVALEQFANAVASYQRALATLQAIEKNCEAVWQATRTSISSGTSAVRIDQDYSFSELLNLRKKQCKKTVAESEKVMNAKLNEFKLTRRKREAVEHYREQQLKYYNREIQKNEQKEIDELSQHRKSDEQIRRFRYETRRGIL